MQMPKNVVLCVDDEPMLLRWCTIAIAEAGFRPVIAENGLAGLETFTQLQNEICLVLSDVMMPELNGVEMAQKILVIRPDTKILLMTGYTNETDRLQGQFGIAEVPIIRKPFLASNLLQKIRSILGLAETS